MILLGAQILKPKKKKKVKESWLKAQEELHRLVRCYVHSDLTGSGAMANSQTMD